MNSVPKATSSKKTDYSGRQSYKLKFSYTSKLLENGIIEYTEMPRYPTHTGIVKNNSESTNLKETEFKRKLFQDFPLHFQARLLGIFENQSKEDREKEVIEIEKKKEISLKLSELVPKFKEKKIENIVEKIVITENLNNDELKNVKKVEDNFVNENVTLKTIEMKKLSKNENKIQDEIDNENKLMPSI